jgi:hypothetical protein
MAADFQYKESRYNQAKTVTKGLQEKSSLIHI